MTRGTSAIDVGSVLGERYELVRHIAGDGSSDVYEGLDRSLRRHVAIKVRRPDLPADRSAFDAEVATLLEDPALRVYDAGEWSDEGGYVVVELADEPMLLATLAEIVRPSSAHAVDGDAPTEVVPIKGGTAVMPAALQPLPPPEPQRPDRRALWALVAVIALIVTFALAQAGGGIDVPTSTTTDSVTVTSQAPSTSAPPTTAEPAAERPGKGKGRGKGDD